MMPVDLDIDAEELKRLQMKFGALEGKAQATIIGRALRRAGSMARTAVVRRAAVQSGMPEGAVRQRTSAVNTGAASAEVVMKSGWWSLEKMGGARAAPVPKLTKAEKKKGMKAPRSPGVTVRNWGFHRGAFLAGMRSSHKGIFVRTSDNRLPIMELWGPNPASFIKNNPEEYEALLVDLQRRVLVPRIEHELKHYLSALRG